VQNFVWVNPGVTLTIEPGVIVKMAGGSGSFIQVRGNLVAIGTAANRITFTSIQDDSIGGDTGGDGSTAGAPGQWSSIAARSLGALTFTYVDVRFGGWGTSLTAYSAILAYNGGSALLNHVRAQFNANSGLLVTGGATANVAHSVFSDNAVGISVAGASAQIHSNSFLTNNSDTGLYIGLISTFTGAATSVMNSEISGNLGWGVYLLIYPDVSQLPYGHQNTQQRGPHSGPATTLFVLRTRAVALDEQLLGRDTERTLL
jgi:hypothetical protein